MPYIYNVNFHVGMEKECRQTVSLAVIEYFLFEPYKSYIGTCVPVVCPSAIEASYVVSEVEALYVGCCQEVSNLRIVVERFIRTVSGQLRPA